jgi:hypothetical protein
MTATPDDEEVGKIARTTDDGSIKEYDVPTPSSQPLGVGPGPAGNDLWFTESTGNNIGRLTADCRPADDNPRSCTDA